MVEGCLREMGRDEKRFVFGRKVEVEGGERVSRSDFSAPRLQHAPSWRKFDALNCVALVQELQS